MLITLSCLFAVSAKEIYVSSDGSDDLNGTDLDNPCSFKRAINISEDGDSIKMKAGNYSISERISKSLNITAYNNDVVNIKHLNSYVFSVVDNKNLVLNSLNFKNFNMAVESSKNPNITINNCLFERSTYMCLNLQGGGTLTITDSIFRNNAGVQGSAINFQNDAYKNRSYVYINNTIFDSNHGSNLGGVIYISLSDMYLYNNTFINNKGDYTGGVIFNDVSRIFDKSSRYVNNGARYSGGAIYIRGDNDLGSYYGDHVEFINNSAPYKNGDPGSYGTSGGVFTAFGGGEIVLNNSVLRGNKGGGRRGRQRHVGGDGGGDLERQRRARPGRQGGHPAPAAQDRRRRRRQERAGGLLHEAVHAQPRHHRRVPAGRGLLRRRPALMPRRRSGAERLRSALLWWTGIALAVLIWHTAARTQPEYVLPGPRST